MLDCAKICTSATTLFFLTACAAEEFNYERLIHLDAETLCEWGIEESYSEDIAPILAQWVEPRAIETFRPETEVYAVKYKDIVFPIRSETSVECWNDAAGLLFHIVNDQLVEQEMKFYAFYGGNDLFGAFLNSDDVALLKRLNKGNEYEQPYLPEYISNGMKQ